MHFLRGSNENSIITIDCRPSAADRADKGGMKFSTRAALAATCIVALSGNAWAQSNDAILSRVEALEKSNSDLKKENAALRERMQRIESGKQTASATPYTAKPAPAAVATAPVYKATPIAVSAPWSWTGFYVGAHGGYARARVTPDTSAGQPPHFDEEGSFGGIQMGVNYQFSDHWMLGFEQDASIGDIKGSFPSCPVCGTVGPAPIKFDVLGSFRERVGYSWNRVLFYETAGVALTHAVMHTVTTMPYGVALEDKRLWTGLAVGGGIEVAAMPNLTFKVEYLFLDFPAKNLFAGTNNSGLGDVQAHTVKVGVN